MKTILTVWIVFLSAASIAPARVWTDSTGKFKMDAEFVRVSDGKVLLQSANGQEKAVPLTRLSNADQQFVKLLVEAIEKAKTEKKSVPRVPLKPFASKEGNFRIVAPGTPQKSEDDGASSLQFVLDTPSNYLSLTIEESEDSFPEGNREVARIFKIMRGEWATATESKLKSYRVSKLDGFHAMTMTLSRTDKNVETITRVKLIMVGTMTYRLEASATAELFDEKQADQFLSSFALLEVPEEDEDGKDGEGKP